MLVTGAAGFIGSHLIEKLVETGEKVRGFDNLSTGRIENLSGVAKSSGFEFIRGDCLNSSDVQRALAGVEHMFHFAVDTEVRVLTQSVRNRADQYEWCRKCICHASEASLK